MKNINMCHWGIFGSFSEYLKKIFFNILGKSSELDALASEDWKYAFPSPTPTSSVSSTDLETFYKKNTDKNAF